MDNNNNNSGFVSYGTTDTIDNQFIQNLLDTVDPTLFYMSDDEPSVMPQQQKNDPIGLLQQVNVPYTEPIVNQGNNNYALPPIGGGVGYNFEAGLSTMRGKEPMFQHQFMLGNNNNFFNGGGGGGLGNFEQALPSNQIPHTNENMGPHNDADLLPLPYWPPIPRPFFCSCCQVLRQIIHTNGNGNQVLNHVTDDMERHEHILYHIF